MTLSVVAHCMVLLALLPARTGPPKVQEAQPVTVELVQAPSPVDAAPTPEPAKPTPAPPSAQPKMVKPAAAPRKMKPVQASEGLPAAAQTGDIEVGEAELASASTSESGPQGRACNMTRWLQSALRKDPRVQAAVAEAQRGKAILLWNGAWIRRGDQDGAGLAAVREALMWEIGFAPVACRTEPVHGLVLITLNDTPGSARLVFGAGQWRWSDLLFARSGAVER